MFEISPAVQDVLDNRRRDRVAIHFQPEGNRSPWRKATNRLLHLKLTSPECFVAIGIESKDPSSLLNELFRILFRAAEKLGVFLAVLCTYGGNQSDDEECGR